MIFAIYYRNADTCGNEDLELVGYLEADSKEEAEKEFPEGFLVGHAVIEVKPKTAGELKSIIKQRFDSSYSSGIPLDNQ